MPTGYTAKIADGISFKDFVFHCARAMGACITMRDDSLDTKIPEEFEACNYHKKEIKKAKVELSKINKMLPVALEKAAKKDYENDVKIHKKRIKESEDLQHKYVKMLARVKAWMPPSENHVNFKNFMIQQIEESIKFDCSNHTLDFKEKLSWEEWKRKQINRINHNIDYHEKEYAKEVERTNERNLWIKQLRNSL